MKKRVRIYKATNGEGQFINKTAQFLKKAQEGGMPDPSEMGYPGSQQQTAQVTDDQLASFVLNEIGTSAPRESIVVKLVNAYGKEPMEAVQFVDKMYKYVEQKQQEEIDSAQEEDADTEEITSGDDVANEMPVEEEVEEVRKTPTGTQMSNEIVDEWDSEGDYDDSEAAANLIMQYGGYYRAQDGAEVPIEMPDLSAYLPQNISDYYGNSDLVSQMAYPELEEKTEEYQGFEAPDMPEDVDFDVARYGGSKKSKKQFVKSVLSLVKKQMGGTNEDSEISSNDADPTGSSVRKQNLDKFINSVKNESTMATAKKQAEEHYEQMMQQQQMPQDDIMRRGGRAGSRDPKVVRGSALRYRASQLRDFLSGRNRRDRRDRRDRNDEMNYNNNNNNYPSSNSQNIYDDKIDYNNDGYSDATDYAFFEQKNQRETNENNRQPNYRLDVRKSNWLTGRPSKYSIEYYGQSPMPGMGSQNQGNGMYTLDGKTYRWPATRKKVEVDAASVNKDAIKEVATATPDSKATTNAAETVVTSTTSTSTEGTVAKDVKAGDIKETVTTTKNGRTTVVPTNYGTIDPSKMKRSDTAASNFATKYLDAEPEAPKAPVVKQRDSWGRPLGDKFYGYNPKTGKYEQGKVEKNWKTKSGNEAKSFDATYTTDWGTVKPARYQIVKDKNGKIIPKKSFAAVTQSEDYGGVIYVPWNELPNRNSDEGEDWNSGAGGDMLENKYGGSINYEIGGSVNDPFMDPYGNLQQFIYGGDEDFTQADIDDVYSKNTANADFPSEYQRGGGVRRLIENYFPGNILGPRRTYRNEIQRVYDPRTGKTVAMPMNMGNLSSVNVDKSRFWSGAPKKYTMYFNGQSGQPITTSKGANASQRGRDRYCLDFPNSPNCQDGKKPVRNNYPEDSRENNKNQRSGRQGYGFINDLKLRMQGLDEYGNPIGSEQSDKIPLSNEQMLKKQGKIWDEKLNKWVNHEIPRLQPLPIGQIDRKPTKIISESSNNNQYNWPGYIDYNQDWMGNVQKLKKNSSEAGNAWNDYINFPEDPANYGYMLDHKTGEIIKNPKGISQDERGLVWSGQYNYPDTSIDESMIWSNPASQEEYNADPGKYDWDDSYIVKNPDGTESSARGYSELTSSDFSPYKENDDLLFEESENADENYDQYVAEMPQNIRKKNYKELNKQIGFDFIQPDGSVSSATIGRKIEEIKKRNSPFRYAPEQVLKQYGGNLDMFIPRAENGSQTPMSPGECPMGSTKNAAGDCVDFMGKVVKKRSTGSDFGNNTQDMKQPGVMDQDYKNPLTGEKPGVIKGADGNLKMNQENPTFYGDQYAVDVENKSDKEKFTWGKNTEKNEARLALFNTGVDILDGISRNIDSRKRENEMYENLNSNNLYASKSTVDKGDYDTNSGLFRPDEQGQMQSSQYGGDVYQDGGYVEGDEVFMTDEEIQEFLANGGDLEFI